MENPQQQHGLSRVSETNGLILRGACFSAHSDILTRSMKELKSSARYRKLNLDVCDRAESSSDVPGMGIGMDVGWKA